MAKELHICLKQKNGSLQNEGKQELCWSALTNDANQSCPIVTTQIVGGEATIVAAIFHFDIFDHQSSIRNTFFIIFQREMTIWNDTFPWTFSLCNQYNSANFIILKIKN